MLSDSEFQQYVNRLTPAQSSSVTSIRNLMIEEGAAWEEVIDEGKWFGGLITYSVNGTFMFAVGPRSHGRSTLHMMPFYGSEVLRERHGEALKPFLTGKSCIQFINYADLPEATLKDIIAAWPKCLEAMAAYKADAAQRKKAKSKSS